MSDESQRLASDADLLIHKSFDSFCSELFYVFTCSIQKHIKARITKESFLVISALLTFEML